MSKETVFIGFLILIAVWVFTGCVSPELEYDEVIVPIDQVAQPVPARPAMVRKPATKKHKPKKDDDDELDL